MGTEFIFYLLSPIFLLALNHSAVLGLILSLTTIGASNALKVFILVKNNYPVVPLNFRESSVFSGSFMEVC